MTRSGGSVPETRSLGGDPNIVLCCIRCGIRPLCRKEPPEGRGPLSQACAAFSMASLLSTGYQQAATWFSSTSPRGGISLRQSSGTASPPATCLALGQRGWNGQPDGGSMGEGTSPWSTTRSVRLPLEWPLGTADRSADV